MKEQKDWESFYNKHTNFQIEDFHFQIASIIRNETKCDDIIDIGCGNGEYSIVFSKIFDSVTSLDISELLVNKFRDTINGEITNIKFVCDDYLNYKFKHDVSFLSFCPVIQTKEDLFYLINHTNKYIYILTVDEGSYDFHRFELLKLFPPRKKQGFIKPLKWYDETLKEMNLIFSLERFNKQWEERIDKETAIDYFISYFSSLGYKREEIENTITEYINTHLIEGQLIEKHVINKVLIRIKL